MIQTLWYKLRIAASITSEYKRRACGLGNN